MDNRPIGVFDSGIGGLTVVNALAKILPHEIIVYVGDTARVPYGNKSTERIQQYSEEITRWLIQEECKIVVVACNTASSTFCVRGIFAITVSSIPMENLLVETDSPYLAPIPYRGKNNEPSYIIHTIKKLSEIKKVPTESVAFDTTNNFIKLFNLA